MVRYTSVALCAIRHLRDIAFISVLSVALCALLYKRFNYHSIFRKNPKGTKTKKRMYLF